MILMLQNQSQGGMFQPLENALSTFLSYIPQLIGALIILIIGYIVAKVLQAVVGRVLQAVGFDRWMERGGIKQFFDRAETDQTPASILGALVFWFVFIIAITMAADALGIPQVSEVLAQLIAYIPSIIAAILILIPVLMPTALAVGIDPIHFVVFFVACLTLGLVTPPVGVCLFATSYVSGLSIERIAKAARPHYAIMIVALILALASAGS